MFDLERITVKEAAEFCESKTSLSGFIERISTDSRDVDENTLFVALRGERFDANDFVPDVLKKGAKAAVSSRKDIDSERIIYVPDTNKAFLDIGSKYRDRFNIPVIALTGSVGKTTTKGMVYSVVSEKYKTLRTEGNLNNEVGVPKTLLRLDKSYEAAVIEMGMNHFGEIERISRAVKPTIGIITNVGTAHIENLGSREGILKAKCEILNGMKKGSPLIINGDNDMLSTLKNDDFDIIRFGINDENLYIKAENIEFKDGGMCFDAATCDERVKAWVPAVGMHNVYNALCALCVGKILGYTLSEASNGLKNFVPEGMRQKITEINGYTFIEDCYNANPDSMRASLSSLNSLKKSRSIAVLGDMMELGSYSETAHREVGEFAGESKTDILLCFGEFSHFTLEGAKKGGVKEALRFDTKKELTEYLKSILKKGDTVLFKGSRSTETEEVFLTLYKEWSE